MMPAVIATALPFASDLAFSAISVFASSISSRMSSDALVETSPTTSPSVFSAVSPLSVIAASECLQQLGEDEGTDERADDRQFGPANRLGSLGRGPGGLARAVAGGVALAAGFHHSGGSSSKTFTQIALAMRVVAIVPPAPRPASRPPPTGLFTNSFCIAAWHSPEIAAVWVLGSSRPPQMASTTSDLA